MTRRLLVRLTVLAAVLVGCGPAGSPVPSATPSPSPGVSPSSPPSPATALTAAQLRIRLIVQFGPLWYCDPDFWPIAREDEQALAVQRWPEVVADADAAAAISAHLGIALSPSPTDAQKLAVYREWKVLRAIALEPAGPERFVFDYLAMPSAGATDGVRTKGAIDQTGAITVSSAARAPEPICPICLARGQLVDTPAGPVAVEALRLGSAVWTLDASGRRVAGTVIALGSTPVPAGHEVVRLVLADGRSLIASPGHPLADGRRLGWLRAGDVVDGVLVVSAARLPYLAGETFDLLVSGPIGVYATGGIWLASTIAPGAR